MPCVCRASSPCRCPQATIRAGVLRRLTAGAGGWLSPSLPQASSQQGTREDGWQALAPMSAPGFSKFPVAGGPSGWASFISRLLGRKVRGERRTSRTAARDRRPKAPAWKPGLGSQTGESQLCCFQAEWPWAHDSTCVAAFLYVKWGDRSSYGSQMNQYVQSAQNSACVERAGPDDGFVLVLACWYCLPLRGPDACPVTARRAI